MTNNVIEFPTNPIILILTEALPLIRDSYIRNIVALDIDGNPTVHDDPRAKKFNIQGAILRAHHNLFIARSVSGKSYYDTYVGLSVYAMCTLRDLDMNLTALEIAETVENYLNFLKGH